MKCGVCGQDTCEWTTDNGKNHCPKCFQDAQEHCELPLTRHANVHKCMICGELVREYGYKIQIGGEYWICKECVVVE